MESLPVDMRSTLPPDAEVDEFKASLLGAKKKSKPKKTLILEMMPDDAPLFAQGSSIQETISGNVMAEMASAAQERDLKYAKVNFYHGILVA